MPNYAVRCCFRQSDASSMHKPMGGLCTSSIAMKSGPTLSAVDFQLLVLKRPGMMACALHPGVHLRTSAGRAQVQPLPK